ncbi:MAG: hydrogenase maturation protease [Dissulfurispiraceae bacterium]
MKTIVIGLGNPILSDDSVGVRIARELKERIESAGQSDVEVIEMYAGGIRLMDAMAGYDRAVIIDSMVTGVERPGTLLRLSLSDLVTTRNTLSVHDMDLPTALEMGRMLGMPIPSEVVIWGIEAKDVENFGEELTAEVEASLSSTIEIIEEDLNFSVRQGAF